MTEQDKVMSNDSVQPVIVFGKKLGRSGSGSEPSNSICSAADEGHERRQTYRDQGKRVGAAKSESGGAGTVGISARDRCGRPASVLIVKQPIMNVCLSIYLLGAVL
jgi:hypothetical protein